MCASAKLRDVIEPAILTGECPPALAAGRGPTATAG